MTRTLTYAQVEQLHTLMDRYQGSEVTIYHEGFMPALGGGRLEDYVSVQVHRAGPVVWDGRVTESGRTMLHAPKAVTA